MTEISSTSSSSQIVAKAYRVLDSLLSEGYVLVFQRYSAFATGGIFAKLRHCKNGNTILLKVHDSLVIIEKNAKEVKRE